MATAKQVQIQEASRVLRWTTSRLQIAPPDGYWAFNPSIIRLPDGRWLCSVRTANYHLPETAGGTAIRLEELALDGSERVGCVAVPQGRHSPKIVFNRNVMLELDPTTWATTRQTEIEERDGGERELVPVRGYDDLRLAWTARDRLCAIANVNHFKASAPREICVLDLDDDHHIVRAQPLRGTWSEIAQKNWTPFVGTGSLRLVYSVERGGIHTRIGRIVSPREKNMAERELRAGGQPSVYAGEEQITLRGGTQLIQCAGLGLDRWLGLAHGVSDLGESGMHYWHAWYSTDHNGTLLAQSRPMKLSAARIEFAAGLAYDPDADELVVSFGMGDDTPMIGRAPTAQVLRQLQPIQRV